MPSVPHLASLPLIHADASLGSAALQVESAARVPYCFDSETAKSLLSCGAAVATTVPGDEVLVVELDPRADGEEVFEAGDETVLGKTIVGDEITAGLTAAGVS